MITDICFQFLTRQKNHIPQNCRKPCPRSSLSWRTYSRFTERSPSPLNLSCLFPQLLPNLCHHFFLLYKHHINMQSYLKFSNHFIFHKPIVIKTFHFKQFSHYSFFYFPASHQELYFLLNTFTAHPTSC